VKPDLSDYPPVMNVTQAAELLGLSPLYLRQLTRMGQVPAHRMGRQIRLYRDELATWLASLPRAEVGHDHRGDG